MRVGQSIQLFQQLVNRQATQEAPKMTGQLVSETLAHPQKIVQQVTDKAEKFIGNRCSLNFQTMHYLG